MSRTQQRQKIDRETLVQSRPEYSPARNEQSSATMAKKMYSSTNCSKHNEEFKLYCQEDEVPVCVICIVAGQHKAHSVVTLSEMLKHAKSTLEAQSGELQRHMTLIQNNMKHVASNIVEVNTATIKLQRQLSQKYRDMIATLKSVEDETMSVVKAEQTRIIKTLNENVSKNEKEAQEIQAVIEQISFLCKGGDIYQIMQDKQDIFSRVQVMMERSNLKSVAVKLENNFHALTEAASKLENRLVEFLIQKWAVNITLDPDTSHPTLEVTDDGKAVSVSEKPLAVALSLKRFTQTTIVLAAQSFDVGKYYWEVIVQEKSDWSVGIVKRSMPRNENTNLTNSPLAWSVAFQQSQYLAWHNSISTSLDITKLHKLGLFLDYDAGQLAFYDASTMNPVHTFSETFNEPVFPAFNPGKSVDKMKKAILIISDGEAKS